MRITRRTAGATALTAVAAAVLIGVAGTAWGAPLYTDDFEDGNTTGWTRTGGSWSVVSDGSNVFRQTSTSADARALAGSTWSDYAVSARVKPLNYNGANAVGVIARASSSTNYYGFAVTGSQARIIKRVNGTVTTIATGTASVPVNAWATLRLEAAGTALRGYVNGTQVVQASDGTHASGRLGVLATSASASFDDVTADLVTSTPPSDGPTSGPPTSQPPPADCTNPPRIIGFAAVNAWGQNGTTGGCGGPVVTVSTASAFLAAIAQPGSLIIQVNGMLTLPGPMHDVTSDKTILGIGANSGITGGGLNIGLPVDNAATSPPANAVHNVIIRNLVFTGTPDDAINVQMFSHHIWIDHNDLSNGYDGLIDIKRGSSYVTVSWNHTHHHTKNMLLGHDDSNGAQDTGQLKVTYHHNFFDRTPQRNPRVRFGEPVHVFNNYYLYNTDIGVACQANAGCVIENNVFEDTEEAYAIDYAGPKGRIVARGNLFLGESFPGTIGGTVQEPSAYYPYTLDSADSVKASVVAGAGTGHI